jgi:hypothetical protein
MILLDIFVRRVLTKLSGGGVKIVYWMCARSGHGNPDFSACHGAVFVSLHLPANVPGTLQRTEEPGDRPFRKSIQLTEIVVAGVAEALGIRQSGDLTVEELCVGRKAVIVPHIRRDHGIIAGSLFLFCHRRFPLDFIRGIWYN